MNNPHFTFSSEPIAGKTMLRAYSGTHKGATAFFRNRALLARLMALIKAETSSEYRVLFHAASVGAEPYSFAACCLESELTARMSIRIDACDINPQFLTFAEQAHYPASAMHSLHPEEKKYFMEVENGDITPIPDIRHRVSFLPCASFVTAAYHEIYDMVFVMNALTYVSEAEQSEAIDRIARYNRRYLVITAFHPDSIESDLRRNGYQPVTEDLRAIHEGWQERIQTEAKPIKGTPEYCWVLPPFSEIEGYQYKYCAIFEKL